jgi:hypothetical protein
MIQHQIHTTFWVLLAYSFIAFHSFAERPISTAEKIPAATPGVSLKIFFKPKGSESEVVSGSCVGVPVGKTAEGDQCRYEVLIPWHCTKAKGNQMSAMFIPEIGFITKLGIIRNPDYQDGEKPDPYHDLAVVSFKSACKSDAEMPIFSFAKKSPQEGDACVILAPDKVVVGTYHPDSENRAFLAKTYDSAPSVRKGHSGSPVTQGLNRRELVGCVVGVPRKVQGAVCVGMECLSWAQTQVGQIAAGKATFDQPGEPLNDKDLKALSAAPPEIASAVEAPKMKTEMMYQAPIAPIPTKKEKRERLVTIKIPGKPDWELNYRFFVSGAKAKTGDKVKIDKQIAEGLGLEVFAQHGATLNGTYEVVKVLEEEKDDADKNPNSDTPGRH